METPRRIPGALIAGAALAFIASAAVTVAWGASMSSMPGMPMPGGWTMSMAWMRMPGQGWPGAVATFLGMWTVMMIAMMLPAFVPMLARARGARWKVAAGYFGAWTSFGLCAWPVGIVAMEVAMRRESLSRMVPLLAAATLIAAGALQFTAWKRRQLRCCHAPSSARGAWREGWQLGLRCVTCCAPLTAMLFVLGVMELAAMALATLAISVERLAPDGTRWARRIGAASIVVGLSALLRAVE